MNHSEGRVDRTLSVLVAEDDRAIRESLDRLLVANGYSVITAVDGATALEVRRKNRIDLLVLDVMMPAVDGLTVCRVLRSENDMIPILMLTALTQPSERVAGLDAGADDYLNKPFDPGELLARVRALLRRSQLATPDGERGAMRYGTGNVLIEQRDEGILRVDDVVVDSAARRCWRGQVEVQLSKIEFDLLELLMINVGIVLSRTLIYEQIWDYDFGPESKNLAVYISYLRRKIDNGREVGLIQTVRGVGYTIRPPDDLAGRGASDGAGDGARVEVSNSDGGRHAGMGQ